MKIDYTRYYAKFHTDTPEHLAVMRRYYQQLLGAYLPADKTVSVLDLGCGMGFALQTLRELGYTALLGVDIDEGQVAAARRRDLPVELVTDSRGWLEARTDSFDLILATDVIEHLPAVEQLALVRALCRALRSGGQLLCTVPNASAALASHWRYNDWTHHGSFTTHSLDFLLFNGGFAAIQVLAADTNPSPRWWWCRPNRAWCYWLAFHFFRRFRRLELMTELGPATGRAVPLSLNLLGIAQKA